MVSALATKKLFAKAKIQMWDHDPGTTNALITSPDGGTTKRYVDMRDFDVFAGIVFATIMGGSGPTLAELVAAEDADGTNVTAIKTSGTVALTTIGDWAALECTAEEIAQLGRASGYALRYVGVRVTCQNAGDEAVVTYIRDYPKNAHSGQTAATCIGGTEA